MVDWITLQEALGFSGVAALLALVIMRFRPELGRPVLFNLAMILVGLIALWALARYQVAPSRLSIALAPREICLLIIALGNIRIIIMFLTGVLLLRRPVPRILGEVSLIFSLIVFALFRMEAIGVNLAGILVASTALVGGIALSLQPMLLNLWGGVSVQLDNTCRIGDWIEIDGVAGEVVSIRWRYTALATVNNVTIAIPNSQLMNTRIALLGRRGDERSAWRRPIEFGVGYEWTPGQVLAVVRAALERVEIPGVAAEPAAQCLCAGFEGSAIKYVVYYWLSDMQLLPGDRFAHAGACLRRAGACRHGDPDLPFRALPALGAQHANVATAAGAAIAGGAASGAGALRAADRGRDAGAGGTARPHAVCPGRHRHPAGRTVRLALYPRARSSRHLSRRR